MSVRQAQAQIDSAEFAEWQVLYDDIEQFEYRADLRAGIVANMMAVAHGAKTNPMDFMPYHQREKERMEQSEAAKAEAAKRIAQALGVANRSKT